jgi:LuxR family transcriptional activator of conjugal transfer of Ti plasmids
LDRWFEKLIDASAIGSDETSLKAALSNLAKELGFERYAYFNLQAAESFAVSDYPREWQERYFARSYSRIDPVVTTAKRCKVTFSWDSSAAGRRPSKELRRFYSEAAEFGIRSGISIPIRTGFGHMAMLTLATAAPSASAEDIDPIIAATTVAQLHARLILRRSGLTSQNTIHLKPEELLCLRWVAEGKTARMIAQIEGISFGNVRFFMENMKSALRAVSLPQATAIGKALGLI